MAKSDFDVQKFIAANSDLGEVQKQGSSVLFIKTKNWGKIEFNYKTGRVIVGSGTSAALREAIVLAIVCKGYQVVKHTKSYTYFKAGADDAQHIAFVGGHLYRDIFGIVTTTPHDVKTVKYPHGLAKKANLARVKAKNDEVAAAAERIAAIKAKNLETIKAVARKRAKAIESIRAVEPINADTVERFKSA